MTKKTADVGQSIVKFLTKKDEHDDVHRGTGLAIIAAAAIILFVVFPMLGIHP